MAKHKQETLLFSSQPPRPEVAKVATQVPISSFSLLIELSQSHDPQPPNGQPPQTVSSLDEESYLALVYTAIQGHQLMTFSNMMWWMTKMTFIDAEHPSSHVPYLAPRHRDVMNKILTGVLYNRTLSRPSQKAWSAMELWRHEQNFDISLKRGQEQYHAAKNYQPDDRERVWLNGKVTPRLKTLLENIQVVFNGGGKTNRLQAASDFLVEAASVLYLTDPIGNFQSWAQPDLVAAGDELVVVDYKFSKQLKKKAVITYADRIELLLQATAARVLQERKMHQRRRKYDKLLFSYLHIEDLPALVENVTIYHQNPEVIVTDPVTHKPEFAEENMTLSDLEVTAAVADLQYLLRWLSVESNKNLLKRRRLTKQLGKGKTPTPELLDTDKPHQPLLFQN